MVSVTHYVVLEFDRSLGGDCPANVPWLEHVLPVNPDAKWFEIFTVEQHEKMSIGSRTFCLSVVR